MIWSIIILILTLLPGKEFPEVHIVGIDKIVHVFIFGLLMVLTAYGFYKLSRQRDSIQNPILISLSYCIIFSVTIELMQQYVPGRSFSMLDIAANVTGVSLGYFGFKVLQRRYG